MRREHGKGYADCLYRRRTWMGRGRAGIRRAVFLLGILSIVSTVVLGAGKGEPKVSQPQKTILRIGTTNEVKSPFPFGDYYLGIWTKISNPPLMTMNEKGDIVGLTAADYRVSEDHKRWTFTIRDNLFWSDGKKLTSQDVAFSISYTGTKNPNAGWIGKTLKQVRTPDPLTVEFEFDKPYTNLNLEFTSYNILPEHIWSKVGEPLSYGEKDAFVGHGPFVVEKMDREGGVISFTKNPYWKGVAPSIDGYEVRMFKSMDTLAFALERGEIDVFYNYAASYPYHYVERLAKIGDFRFEEKLNQGLVFLAFNLHRPMLAQGKFREAIAYSVDYTEIIRLDALGYGQTPLRGFVPPTIGGHIPTEPLRYDPDRAKALLDALGYRDTNGDGIREAEGKEIRLTLLIRSEYSRIAELIRDYLKKIGILAEIRAVDLSGWVAEKDHYRYDLTITRTTPWGMLMHAGFGTGYFDSRRTGQGVLHTLTDPEFHSLCDQVLSTTEREKILFLGAHIQRYYAAHLPGFPLYWNKIVIPYRTGIEGLISDPLFGIYSVESLLKVRKK